MVDAPRVLALQAVGWTLENDDRAQRLLAVTGLTPDDLRTRLDQPSLLAAILSFLEANEADLIACAADLGCSPDALVRAREALDA